MKAEEIAYSAGKTAQERIGDKAMCYDPIMQELVVEARTPAGWAYNERVMKAWLKGRGWEWPEND